MFKFIKIIKNTLSFNMNFKDKLLREAVLEVLGSCQSILDRANSMDWIQTRLLVNDFLNVADHCNKITDSKLHYYATSYVNSLIINLCGDFSDNQIAKVYPDNNSNKPVITLIREINLILIKQLKKNSDFIYEMGFPYQALETLNIFGSRKSYSRLIDYQLCDFIKKKETVLDIGGNSGFLCILISQIIRCYATVYDHNKYYLKIGKLVAKHLKITNLVKFIKTDINKTLSNKKHYKFDHIFSFASHFTDDGGIKNSYEKHFELITNNLKPYGKIYFESHNVDAKSHKLELFISQARKKFNLKVSLDKMLNANRRYLVFEKMN